MSQFAMRHRTPAGPHARKIEACQRRLILGAARPGVQGDLQMEQTTRIVGSLSASPIAFVGAGVIGEAMIGPAAEGDAGATLRKGPAEQR